MNLSKSISKENRRKPCGVFYAGSQSEGFTGTGGAVKPRSSVDVDELRSSKSMDDEPEQNHHSTQGFASQNRYCNISLHNIYRI